MSNIIDIKLTTDDEELLTEKYALMCKLGRCIHTVDIPNIYGVAGNASQEDFINALNTVIAFMVQKEYQHVIGDIDKLESELNKTREMTLDEIEKELGYKVHLVANKDKREVEN